ncbi:adenomatous polyposis coli protein-like [Cydia amplana]|uniref:adenomatous polyposis coli protein-like n=1 Tax=Cydia amplana TaxID=1869771 RepID=UPI002FE5CAB4
MNRDYYKVSYTSNRMPTISDDVLDNVVDTEFNANQFKLFDDFTTDMRINFNSSSFRRRGDPNDSGVDMENGNPMDDTNETDLLENEVMVDPWSSMDSSNSPLTDSVPSASDDCTPSTSSEPPRGSQDPSPLSPEARRPIDSKHPKPPQTLPPKTDKARSRDLTLALDPDPLPRRHFLDDDYQNPSKSNIECRIPKPHFLDHSPSPDEFDERSDITNPNFLDDEAEDDQAQKKAGALPKKTTKNSSYLPQEERPHRTSYRSTLHYGLENAARSSERDKRASQLYRGTWPGERDIWTGHDTASVRSFSSNGSAEGHRPSSNLDNKMDCVISLISLLSLSPENNADLSGPLLEMSRSVESCIAMRQAGCIPLLVQLIHSKVPRETRDRAAKALRNIIHTQTDDKAGRREARVWRLLEQVREYCYILEDVVENRKEGKEVIEDDGSKHPSQSVAALMKLSFDEEHRHVVCQLGGLQALAALVSGDQAAHGSRTDDNTCLTMRKYAGMTLTNLTFGDGNNKSLLCSFKDFMLALVEQLESPNDDMRQVTAAVLRNLSWRADTSSKQVLREVGAVKGLTKAAMTCQKEATLKSVLSALWNLTAHCSMNKVALCSVDGALGFLVDMLSYDSPTKTLAIVENAGGIMRNVSSHIAVREDYRQILRERNCLSVLLQHLKSPSLTVVSNSCGTLWNLSARCPQDQQFLWDHGAVPMLRSLIHSKHKMIAMGSGAALKNLLNSKPGKTHIISLDSTARTMNLPALPTLGARKQKALEQELDQNLAETCDNIEPATSPTTSNRDEKSLFTATERQIAMNLNRMSSSSPLMGALTSQISLSHSAHLASYLSCSNTLLKGALVTRSTTGSSSNVNRSDSKDSVTSAHSDTVFERVMRTGKVPVPTPRNKDLMKSESGGEAFKMVSKPLAKDGFLRYPTQPPIPPPRTTDMRTNYTESGYDVDQDSCDQPIDFSRKYSETKTNEPEPSLAEGKPKATKKYKKDSPSTFGDYQETDLDQPTDYSLRYAEHQSENGSDISEPAAHEDTIKHFATEGTPYETPIIFSTATSMSDLRVIGKDGKPKSTPSVKENPEVMTHSDEKDTCSIEDPPRHDNDRAIVTPQNPEPIPEKRSVFDTKFSSGMISPEKPVNYCDEGTPGYFSRVSSLSSLGEPTEEDSLAKKNAMATINVEPSVQDQSASSSKDKEGSKAVTFATDPVAVSSQPSTPGRFVEDTPLMFSRSSSLGSLPEADEQQDQGSVLSEVSRLTSGCISPSEIPDSPGAPASPRCADVATPPPVCEPELDLRDRREVSVFEERTSQFMVENTPAQCSPPNLSSLSSLTIEEEVKVSVGKPVVFERNLSPVCEPELDPRDCREVSVFEERTSQFMVENTPAQCSPPNLSSLSSLTIEEEVKVSVGKPVVFERNLSPVCEPELDPRDCREVSVFEERTSQFMVENTPAQCSPPNLSSLSSLTIEEEVKVSVGKPVVFERNLSPVCEPELDPRDCREVSVFEERTSQFMVENTPAQCSPPNLSSLSSLTIEEEVKPSELSLKLSIEDNGCKNDGSERSPAPRALPVRTISAPLRGTQTPGDTCQVYFTEDTPAILSKAGSNSNLSVLSIDSAPPRNAPDTSDSSNLSDADLLEDCIQKGIANVVKNKPSSDLSQVNYSDRDNVYRSLPPYLRTSTETVKMSHEHERNVRVSPSPVTSAPAPPLPPKDSRRAAPPRPPRAARPDHEPSARPERRRESRLPIKSARNLEKHFPAAHDSSSSLSLDSFGSTDREIFEETVQAGLGHARHKAHSVERPADHARPARHHRSLDRSDKISQHRPKVKDEEFERNLASGVYNIKNGPRGRRLDRELAPTRSPYSYHGESSAHRFRGHSRYYDDGPPSLPARIDEPRRQPERSNSLSSLSNDSFGSTDKEVFERCVRMGMSKAQPRSEKLRGRSDDRAERRDDRAERRDDRTERRDDRTERRDDRTERRDDRTERRRRKDNRSQGALDRMVGEEARDRALLEAVIARGAGAGAGQHSKNVPAPPAAAPAPAAGGAETTPTRRPGSDDPVPSLAPSLDSREPPASTLTSNGLNRSNECLAPQSANTTLDSEVRDELDRSNESYADVLDGSWSDEPRNCEAATLTRRLEYSDIKYPERVFEESKHDTWNDSTCPDDVTFPTMSGSVHMVSSIRSEIADAALALPDLLEKSESVMSPRPDLTNKLDSNLQITEDNQLGDVMLDNIPEPSYTSLVDDGEQKFDSLMASAIEKEAARLAAQLKSSTYGMENSVTSLTSLDLDNVKPPSHLGSLLSLSASGQWDDTSKKSQKSRKKSLPVAMMVKRALSNSMHQGSSEHLDSNPVSFLDNVKPPSEMENLDMESSMVSVSSIVSEIADREKTPIVFDFKQPIQDFPLCHNFNLLDLDKVNPPSLFDEMAESTVEIEPTTAHQLHDEISSTLNVVTDIPSGSENCTPLPSDMSSVESTPKKTRDSKYLTPKEKRNVAKDRYQTYTIIDPPSESDVLTVASEEFMTWTKSESDRSDDYVTANSDAKSKRKMSAKQRRLEDRARYQTQTVNIQSIIQETKAVDPQIESLKQRLAAKKTVKQKRVEDAERFRTRTLSEDIPPSPTFVTKDASFENVETTTGYDSLSSNELNHQQIIDDRQDVFRETDSGHNEDDFELNSTQMQTYTKSFRNYLPVIESPAAVDICVVNNLKNIEMTASYRRALQSDKVQNPSSSDFASYEGDTHSDNDSEEEAPRPKPKITKPERRDESLDSNDSHEKEPKAVRGRKKAAYVSPYRRSVPPAKKPTTTPAKAPVKAIVPPKPSAKAPSKTPTTSKPPSANTSPKKTLNKSPSKIAQKAVAIPLVAGKPLPLERQGTFTKESSVPAKNLPVPVAEKKPIVSRYAKTAPKPAVNTSPSRLPQLNRYSKPPLKKGGSSEKPAPKPKSAMRNSASNHSLQSNDSAKTVTLASRGSRQGSTSSVNSAQSSKINSKDVESKIASLWKKVEQTKKVISKPDKRVWIESDKTEQPKLIRSSTFEGQPKQAQVSTAPKQKTAIGIKVSQIPSLRPKSTPSKVTAPSVKKPVITRVFTRKPANGPVT